MSLKHLVTSQDVDKAGYDEMLRRTNKFIAEGIPYGLLKGKVVATLFFQCSTRTMTSFQSGSIRAGGGWVGVTSSDELSMGKEETWEDTIVTYGSLADCIVLRHPEDDAAERAAKVSSIPIINGGSGTREHALAGILLLAMLQYYLKRPLDGLKIGIYGTPGAKSGGGRCCNAFIPIIGHYGVEIIVDDLDGAFPIPEQIEKAARKNGAKDLRYDALDNFIGDVDVLILTKGTAKQLAEKSEHAQKTFHPIGNIEMKKMRDDAALMVLTPRYDEVKPEVDSDPRSLHMKYNPFQEAAVAVMTYLLDIPVN